MPFSARNARYLRISAHTVLPLYIYLDEKHIEWMSDYTLQRVLEDLRPEIGPKLRAESSMFSAGSGHAKKGTVDVYRGDTYQFAYFLRKNEPHAVLIKGRKFISTPIPGKDASSLEPQLSEATPRKRKRGGTETKPTRVTSADGTSSRSARDIFLMSESDEDDAPEGITADGDVPAPTDGEAPRRSRRAKKLIAGGYREHLGDISMVDPDANASEAGSAGHSTEATGVVDETITTTPVLDSDSGPPFSPIFDIDAEAGEEKPKLVMRVSYQGFTIYDRCLCVVIEPWPTLREASRAPPVAPSLALDEMRMSSMAPNEQRERTPIPLRERTPLFLPEIDPRRSLTPAPLPSRILPPVPLYDDLVDSRSQSEDTENGMMAFSQALKSVGGERAGSADDDENEGEAFLGDADERRGDP